MRSVQKMNRYQVIAAVDAARKAGERPDLSRADLVYVDLSGLDLSNVNLAGADLRHANLAFTDFTGSNLQAADLREAILPMNGLAQAHMHGADLDRTDTTGITLPDHVSRHSDDAPSFGSEHYSDGVWG